MYNTQKWKEGEPLGALLYHLHPSESYITFALRAQSFCRVNQPFEQVQTGILGHEGRTMVPSMLCRTFSLLQLIHLALVVCLSLFSTYVFHLHCINLHLIACCFVFSSHICIVCVPDWNVSFLKAEAMPLVSFVFPIAPFTVLSREWAYSICVEWPPEWPSLAGPKIKFPQMEQS